MSLLSSTMRIESDFDQNSVEGSILLDESPEPEVPDLPDSDAMPECDDVSAWVDCASSAVSADQVLASSTKLWTAREKPTVVGGASSSTRSAGRCADPRGRRTTKADPCEPSALSSLVREVTARVPPWTLMSSSVRLRPTPVPSKDRPVLATRWNRSTTLGTSAWGMPTPVSYAVGRGEVYQHVGNILGIETAVDVPRRRTRHRWIRSG
jgi:hypothetical protein